MAKPSTLPEWDTTGVNAVEPDTVHKQQGWVAPGGIPEKPPFQTFNHWMNASYKWIKELNQQGIVEWDGGTTYEVNDITKGSNGLLYSSIASSNTNNNPTLSPLSWKELSKDVVGTMIDFGGTTAPNGYLVCDGSEVSQVIYADLFAVIGTNFDTTAGVLAPSAGNFRLPPSEVGGLGLFYRGVGAINGGVGTFLGDVFKSHNHTATQGNHVHGNPIGNFWVEAGTLGATLTTSGVQKIGLSGSTSSDSSGLITVNSIGDATETRPVSLAVLKCIKF